MGSKMQYSIVGLLYLPILNKAKTIQCSFFFQAEDGIRDVAVTGVQTCALPICALAAPAWPGTGGRGAGGASRAGRKSAVWGKSIGPGGGPLDHTQKRGTTA